jgi:hypothetical protein
LKQTFATIKQYAVLHITTAGDNDDIYYND